MPLPLKKPGHFESVSHALAMFCCLRDPKNLFPETKFLLQITVYEAKLIHQLLTFSSSETWTIAERLSERATQTQLHTNTRIHGGI